MSSEESNTEIQTVSQKKKLKRRPKADISKKKDKNKKYESIEDLVNQALFELKRRNGTSLFGIKKYLEDKYNVDVEKYNYFIKTYLETSVELGTIVKVKGVGVTATYKLAPEKEKSEKKKKPTKKPEETSETEKPKTKPVKKLESNENNAAAKKNDMLKKKVEKKGSDVENKSSSEKDKAVKTKMAKVMQTPAKKRAAQMKRKSVGSIIKPPKMNPKATKNEATKNEATKNEAIKNKATKNEDTKNKS